MIGFFVKAGDIEVDKIFSQYIWPFRDIVKRNIEGNTYGFSLELILIEYLLEGKFIPFLKKRIKLSRIRKKEKAISVTVGVPREFGEWNEPDKKKFIANTTIESLQKVSDYLLRKGYTDIDFPQLLSDINHCANLYLELTNAKEGLSKKRADT